MAQENDSQHTLDQPVEADLHTKEPATGALHGARGTDESWRATQRRAVTLLMIRCRRSSLMGHVKDAEYFHFPRVFSPATDGRIAIPQFRESTTPIVQIKTGFEPIDDLIEPLNSG